MEMPRKMCNESGCVKGAIGTTDKCTAHGGGKRCTEPGCTKSSQGKNDKCKAHGGGKRCIESGCTKSSIGTTNKCTAHGRGKRCSEPGCMKSAQSPTDKCFAHGGGKRCTESGCTKSAQSPTDKCFAHGGGKRCSEPGCMKSAQNPTDKCASHGGGKRCPHCITWPDSRGGSTAYDGYCATCFKQLFPTDERSKVIYTHTKEIRVRNAINDAFEGFIHDKPLYTGQCNCTHRRRIDHRKLIGATLLCIETDEFGHAGYDPKDEELRYDDLYMIHSGKWIFIRFNPDGKGVDKLDRLMQEIQIQIERIENDDNNELLEIIKLYY